MSKASLHKHGRLAAAHVLARAMAALALVGGMWAGTAAAQQATIVPPGSGKSLELPASRPVQPAGPQGPVAERALIPLLGLEPVPGVAKSQDSSQPGEVHYQRRQAQGLAKLQSASASTGGICQTQPVSKEKAKQLEEAGDVLCVPANGTGGSQ